MKEIPSKYNAKEVESRIYAEWEKKGRFGACPSKDKKPFTIVIPPPNVTGILHMGHALNNAIQDILVRWKRMQGFQALWVPGTDHAGIATQNVVERKLAREGKKRDDLGREEFLKEVWRWKEDHGSTIINQLKRLGSSCDWSRLRFTMDEEYSESVKEVFCRLWNTRGGEIYPGERIINWCPRCHTALSDEEAPHQEKEGFLYYIRYPFKEAQGSRLKAEGIVVGTTRPETMLGDVAVAVNPKDRRYKSLIGEKLVLPLMEREIPVISDDFVDKKFGTGAVKITPAHDPNDFEMGLRHKIEPVLVMNPDGTMNENAGDYEGMDRFKAREAIIKSLKERDLLIKIESHSHAVGHCYRCNTIVEPYMSAQIFVMMKNLAKPAIDAVKKGKIKFYPERWTKVYLHWMENIRDWCISRQIWWGHRIPLYYCAKCHEGGKQATKDKGPAYRQGRQGTGKKLICSKMKPEKCPECGGSEIKQHEDVLDTWFSSWLWPFATLGWPKETKELDYFYPTDVLVTAPEILFFWVARMIMSGMEFMKEIPFRDVYIHGTVRDATGRKMSKSLGNTIDPLEVIEEFGADALRYSIIAITSTGQDVFLSKDKFQIGRNFANKIWNASRFVLMNVGDMLHEAWDVDVKKVDLSDRWILSRLQRTISDVDKALEQYRFNEAGALIYDFFWHDYCDWYIEMAKPFISDKRQATGGKGKNTKKIMIYVLEQVLKLLHPFMPFVTEAVWQNISERESIMIQDWPVTDNKLIDKKSEKAINSIKRVIVGIRNIRAEMNIPHSKYLKVRIVPLKKGAKERISESEGIIKNLARVEELTVAEKIKKPEASATNVLEDFNIYVSLKGVIDIEAEKARLTARKKGIESQLGVISKKLKNRNFMEKAPEKIVAGEKDKFLNLKEQIKRIEGTLKNLG